MLLAGKIGNYDTLLRTAYPKAPPEGADEAQRAELAAGDAIRNRLRQQLPNDLLVQYLAGPSDMRDRALGSMLRLVAWLTMVLGPLMVFLIVQYKFLPYQDEVPTWAQRAAVVGDLALLWALWPAVASGRGALYLPVTRLGLGGVLASAAVAYLAFCAMTFPGGVAGRHAAEPGVSRDDGLAARGERGCRDLSEKG